MQYVTSTSPSTPNTTVPSSPGLCCRKRTFWGGGGDLFAHPHGKIPNWILYFCYATFCEGIQQILCLDRNLVQTGRAVIMPQGNNKNVQYIVHVNDPHRLRTVTKVNRHINIAPVSDFDANVSRVSRFHRRNVLDESKTIDWRNHRDLKVENGLGEKVFCYQEDAVLAMGGIHV